MCSLARWILTNFRLVKISHPMQRGFEVCKNCSFSVKLKPYIMIFCCHSIKVLVHAGLSKQCRPRLDAAECLCC